MSSVVIMRTSLQREFLYNVRHLSKLLVLMANALQINV